MYNTMPFIAPNTLGSAASINPTTGTSLFSKINWSSLLSNTQKVLNVANQAIPLYHQTKPIFQNIKTITKIGKEFKNMSSSMNNNTSSIMPDINNELSTSLEKENNIPTPTFFI